LEVIFLNKQYFTGFRFHKSQIALFPRLVKIDTTTESKRQL